MKRRSFITLSSLGAASIVLGAKTPSETPTTLEQWQTKNRCQNGTLYLKAGHVQPEIESLGKIIQSPIQTSGSELSFQHLKKVHRITLRIVS